MQKNVVKTYIDRLNSLGLLKSHSLDDEVLKKQVECVSYDTRTMHGNTIFICKGAHFIPDYAHEAFEKGAICYVSEKEIDSLDNAVIVSDIRGAIVALAKLHFDNSPEKIKSIGITGTKGKGSTAYILMSILNSYLISINKPKSAIISSIDTYDGIQNFESHLTTPETIELHEHFANAYNSGITHLIMEVSSLAIKFGRTTGIPYEVACFTNFGQDHISKIEHPDMQDYFESKLRIFDSAKFGCVYSNSDRASEIISYAKNKCELITYGEKPEDDIFCSNIELCGSYSKFHVKTPVFEHDFVLNIPGLFNVYNALAAIAISHCLDIPKKYIEEGLKNASIPGRMKTVKSKDNKITVIIDYAHNQMSFNALYDSISQEYSDSKIIGIFGCPGLKALDRRKDLPEIASKYCDHIIICEEDSGPEPFDNIAKDLVSNIAIENFDIIEDREEALKHAIFDLSDGNTVIAFTGKGEETRLKRNDVYEPCESDLAFAEKLIAEYDKSVGV